jgi:hypothetical protein
VTSVQRLGLFWTILAAGVAVRAVFWWTPEIDSDMAVTGLMARHILNGAFPIFFWGQPYCGPLEAFLAAPAFLLAGPTVSVLNAVPTAQSVVFVALVYLLGKRSGGEMAGLIAMALAAVGPSYYMLHNVLPRANYIENLLLCAALFLIAARCQDPRGRRIESRLVALGFVSGVGWWMNFQSLPAIAAAWGFVVAFRFRSLRAVSVANLAGFAILGSLPFWIYNVENGFSSFQTARSVKWAEVPEQIRWMICEKVPYVLGLSEVSDTSVGRWAAVIAGGMYAASVLYALFRSVADLRGGRVSIPAMAVVFVGLWIGAFVLSGFAVASTPRYLIPLFAVLPVLIGIFVLSFDGKTRGFAWAVVVLLLGVNVSGLVNTAPVLNAEEGKRYRAEIQIDERILALVRKMNIDGVYVDSYWDGPRLTFLGGETTVFALPSRGRQVRYEKALGRAERAAFLLTGGVARAFEDTFPAIGGEYRRTIVGRDAPDRRGMALFHDFLPPKPRNERLVASAGWVVTASHQSRLAPLAVDRSAKTRWGTGAPQRPGMFFEVDLGREVRLGRLTLDLKDWQSDYPRAFRVEVARDSDVWSVVSRVEFYSYFSWREGAAHPNMDGGIVQIRLDSVPARRIRIVQTGKDGVFDWSIGEIIVHEVVS